jgi:RNA polymerase sigma-70 factor (ECF subfamily)
VRTGDAERYRELVERHERRVYAVAWSRLGDATLAEEVTQEAFIRAYRRLWLLGDAGKFSGWIASIARHVAINFGMRRRRELNKRERWALEQTQAADSPDAEADAPCTPETLRHTLAELPAAHRECLVLFYLEGRSGVEAAATLGISEAALRVRLHRTRAALRERLEQKLANMAGIFPFFTRCASHLTLHWDGSVNAHCSNTDTRALRDLADAQAGPSDELDQYIARVVETAWRACRDGKTNVAIAALGETPEADVFVVPPHQSKAARVWQWVLIGCVVLMLPSVVIQFVLPTRMSGLKPVSLTETDVRAAMVELTRPPERKNPLNNGLSLFLWSAFVLPPTNLFTADALIAIRRVIRRFSARSAARTPAASRRSWATGSPSRRLARGPNWPWTARSCAAVAGTMASRSSCSPPSRTTCG